MEPCRLRSDPSDVDDAGRRRHKLRLDTPHSGGSQRKFVALAVLQRPRFSAGYPVQRLRLARRLARVTIDDHHRPTKGLSRDDILTVNATQA